MEDEANSNVYNQPRFKVDRPYFDFHLFNCENLDLMVLGPVNLLTS